MDAIDRKILAVVQDDASLSVAEIGSRVGLSSTPCWKRIQRLEAEGVITKRVALIDPSKIGLGITGISGPGGATPGKPVGLTFVAVDSDKHSAVKKHQWTFDRAGNRLASVGAALDLLEDAIG